MRYPDKPERTRLEKRLLEPKPELDYQVCEVCVYLLTQKIKVEANTPSEINELLGDINKLRINSLLVRERILGPKNPQTFHYIRYPFHHFTRKYATFRYRGAIYADSGDYQKCLDLWSYGYFTSFFPNYYLFSIKLQIRSLAVLHPSISTSFLSFVDFFAFCETKQLRNDKELEKFFFVFDQHLR